MKYTILFIAMMLLATSSAQAKWHIREEISPMDDSKTVALLKYATGHIEGMFGSKIAPNLSIVCLENHTEVSIKVYHFISSGGVKVTTRLDKEKARTSTWNVLSVNDRIFVRDGGAKYAKSLMKHDTLLVRLATYRGDVVTFSFDLSGLSEAIAPLRKACHW